MQGEQPPNQVPANRLVLPGTDDTSSSPEQLMQRAQTLPEHRAARSSSLANAANPIHTDRPRLSSASIPAMPRVAPPGRTKTDWRRDPAYKFLFIAIGVVLLASILFVAFAGSTISSLFSQSGAGTTQTAPGGIPAQGTADTNPKFPTPGGNTGATPTSQPTTLPSPTATTAPNPTPTTPPSPTPTQNPQLTLQIVNAPNQVNNNSTVTITVTASQPGVQVGLTITYNTNPFLKTLGPQATDNNGNAAFSWSVQVHPFSRNQVFARLVAIARKNGQEVTSQTVVVKIVVRGGITGG